MSDLHKSTCPTILPACNCDLPLAERQFVAAALGDPAAVLADQRPEGVTVTEWGYRALGGLPVKAGGEEFARGVATRMNYPVITRQRTTFPDVVTEWAEVSGDTEAAPAQRNVATFTHRLTEYGTTTCPVEGVRAHVDAGACSACGMAVPGDTEAGGHSVLICETPNGCTCGAPATTPRGMHHGYCTVRKPAPGNTEAGGES